MACISSHFEELRLRRRHERICSLADQLKLMFFGMQKFKAVLKALAIPDFGLQLQRLSAFRHLKFQFNDIAKFDIARNGCAQSALRDVFSAAMVALLRPGDDAYIQKKSSVGPGCGPCLLALNGHGLPKLSQQDEACVYFKATYLLSGAFEWPMPHAP
jgi:hypothetical protein